MTSRFRFGPFEFDLASGELRRFEASDADSTRGATLCRLPPQPARLLQLLLEGNGDLVTRETIRRELWPDTQVDFDAGLHFCVRQVRAALGDSATAPRFVATVPRRGYRFVSPVHRVRADADDNDKQSTATVPSTAAGTASDHAEGRAGRPPLRLAAIAAVVVLGLLTVVATTAMTGGGSTKQTAWLRWFGGEASPSLRVGIMPFEPPAGTQGFGPWRPVAEWILEDLAEAGGGAVALVGPTSTAAYNDSDQSLQQLVTDYDLDYVINGRFLDTGGGPRVLGELIRASDGAHVWVGGFDDPRGGRELGLEISAQVARALGLQ